MAWASSQPLHMVSFENFVKSMLPSLSESKVTPSFCFPFKIPDDPTATSNYVVLNHDLIYFHYILIFINGKFSN